MLCTEQIFLFGIVRVNPVERMMQKFTAVVYSGKFEHSSSEELFTAMLLLDEL